MKKIFMRIAAVMIAAALISALASGCKRGDDSLLYVPPEFVYVPQSIPLPTDLGDIYNLTYSGGKIYFVATAYDYGNELNNYSYTIQTDIYSIDLDGSGLTKLINYKPPASAPAGASGGTYVNGFFAETDNSLWIYERWDYSGYELPDDFNPETDEAWQYYVQYDNGNAIRKLDSTGAELLSIDLSPLSGGQDYFYINSFNIDAGGNIYLSSPDYERGGQTLTVLGRDGSKLFDIKTENWIDQLIRMPDGTIAFRGESYDDAGRYTPALQKIDFAARALGETAALPNIGWQIFPGSNEHDILIQDSNNVYGFNFGDEEPEKLLNWIESDIINDGIQNITVLPDERILCINRTWDRMTGESSNELLLLTKTPYSELPQKTVLTLATFYMWNIRDAVVKYNRESPDYRIQVIDYAEFNTDDDYNAGRTRLSTELISGRLPDILDVSQLPYKEYVARGMLADLYPLIDSDPDYSRGDFVDGAFRAAEIDGKLYQIFPSFYVQTIVGHPSVLGPEMGWTVEEFNNVLRSHPDADMPLGSWLTKTQFLQAAVSFSIDEYIDWGKGTAHFDTPEFIQLLELSNTFPDDIDYDNIDWDLYNETWISPEEAIATGRQIMQQMGFSDFWSYQWNKAMFGGDLVFKGFPNENRSGNSLTVDGSSLAIIEKSGNKEAAWDFMRTILNKDWQLSNTWAFPVNQAAFDEKVKNAMDQDYGGDIGMVRPMRVIDGGNANYTQPQIQNLTQADVDKIKALISSASGTAGWNIDQSIWEIISEGVSDYFKGASNAQDVARVIQSRVSILVSERS